MKLSLTVLPLFLALTMAMPVAERVPKNELHRRFSGGSLPEALANEGGIHSFLDKLLEGMGGIGGTKGPAEATAGAAGAAADAAAGTRAEAI